MIALTEKAEMGHPTYCLCSAGPIPCRMVTSPHSREGRAPLRASVRRLLVFLHDRPFGTVMVIALALRVPLVFAEITYRGDIWRQADTASIARNFHEHGYRLFFPQILWGGNGPGYVESEFQLFPWITSLLYGLFGERVWLGRAVSLVATGGALVAFSMLARRMLTRRAALVALVFFAFAPLMVKYSTAFMPEATVLCFYVLALLAFDRWLESRSWNDLLATAGLAAVAFLVKPTSLHLGVVFVLALLLRHGWRALVTRQTVVLAAVSLLPITAWLVHGRRLYQQYGNTFGVISGGDRKFGSIDYWTSAGFYKGVTKLDFLWIFAAATLPLFAVGLALALKRHRPALLIAGVVTIGIYYAAAARYTQSEMGIQYHIFAVVYAALAVGLGADWIVEWVVNSDRAWMRPATFGALGASAVMFLAASAFVEVDQFRDNGSSAMSCAAAMRELIPRDSLIVGSSSNPAVDQGVANNWQDPVLFFHGQVRGWSLAADQHRPDLVEQYRLAGARWFVIEARSRLDANPDLAAYLEQWPQVGPGVDNGCGIYQLT